MDKHQLSGHIQLNTRLVRACWDDEHQRWEARNQHGGVHHAQWLISAVGGLSRPAWPNIPGLENFEGRITHSQQWPEKLALKHKRVAVIGTGASAIQFIPHLQRGVKHLDIYQRSPQWILPKPDRPIPDWRRRLLSRVPLYRRLTRLSLFLLLESRLPAFTRFPRLTAFHRWKARRHLARQVSDPTLRKQLTPDYAMGCKRVLMSSDYYPALSASNVELVASPIESIKTNGIVDHSGRLRACEHIILSTGFQATSPFPKGMIIGRDGQDLAAAWKDGPFAYKGSTVPGFPNFLTLLGPNTALGHNSVLLMIEAQIRYLLSALRWSEKTRQRVVEVTPAATAAWNADLERRLSKTVWSLGSCSSWYKHAKNGRIPTLWPRFTFTFRWLLRRFDPKAYGFR